MVTAVVPSIAHLAEQAFDQGHVLQETERYRVYALPSGPLDHFVLVLPTPPFAIATDLSPSLVLPVTVRERRGYLVVREAALNTWEEAHRPIHTETHHAA